MFLSSLSASIVQFSCAVCVVTYTSRCHRNELGGDVVGTEHVPVPFPGTVALAFLGNEWLFLGNEWGGQGGRVGKIGCTHTYCTFFLITSLSFHIPI